MSQRTLARPRQTATVTPRQMATMPPIPPPMPVPPKGGITPFLERAAQAVLTATYWFTPAPRPHPYPVTVKFTGQRCDGEGPSQPEDQFVHYETIDAVVSGSGPMALTVRIRDLPPGAWSVTAHLVGGTPAKHKRGVPVRTPSDDVAPGPIARFWRRWAPSIEATTPHKTGFSPLARVPGILPGGWVVLVTVGIVLALTIQSLMMAHQRVSVGPRWLITMLALLVGIAGGKGWFLLKHHRTHRWEGWCIQGFIVGATLMAGSLLIRFAVPASAFLDPLAPGLLFGLAVGRVGCFVGGCCGGPPTASRWGIWSSDQRVGARRIPTQLIESAYALSLGIVVLVTSMSRGPAGGAYFVAALAAYTLGRQGILRLRAEPQQRRWDSIVTALATLTLAAAVVFIARVTS